MGAPTPTSPGGPDAENRAGLSWGVKGSFTRYIDSMPDGRRGSGHGATEAGDGVYFFELDDASGRGPERGETVLKYRGDVRYKGHGGMLFVMIVDPWVEFRPEGTVLTVVNAEHWPAKERRIELATLVPGQPGEAGLPEGWRRFDAFLAPAAVEVFNGVYAAGEPLEPVAFRAGA
jgi:hypothetical protein